MAEVVLALDVGEARIGLARGERGAPWAFGRGALTRSGALARDVAAVAEVAAAEGARRLVVGLPVRAQGGDSEQTRRVRAFADALAARGLAVELVDERFTTALATRQLRTGATKAQRRAKGLVDEASAVAILETWLARQAAGGAPTDAAAGTPDGASDAEDRA